jgi:peptide-methionine (R)-S-oxide reductase
MNTYGVLAVLVLCAVALGCERAAAGGGGDKQPEGQKPTTRPAATGPVEKVEKSEEEWKKILSPEEYRILRQKGTERAFSGKYDKFYEPGTYSCAACGFELFKSDTKFNSGCGWPSFYAAAAGDRIKQTQDLSHGMVRIEVTCARCGGHLGHVFDDAPDQPTGLRYCINSVSIKFTPAGEKKDEAKK